MPTTRLGERVLSDQLAESRLDIPRELGIYALNVCAKAKRAVAPLSIAPTDQKNRWLRESARQIRAQQTQLLAANELDLQRSGQFNLNDAEIDRLRLTPKRLEQMATSLDEIADLPDPIGELVEDRSRPNGLTIHRVRVPLGVVFFIYESRPNVTSDAAAICLKSGNPVILRGGKEALNSNLAIAQLMDRVRVDVGLPDGAIQLVEQTDRRLIDEFLARSESIAVTIPRGGRGLIERVAAKATMPVIKHYDGICHVYVHQSADLGMAKEIVINAKCQRPGVCNAAECLLVDASIADTFLPSMAQLLHEQGVELRGCERTCQLTPHALCASEEDFRTEYLALRMSIKVVPDIRMAIEHIGAYGSHHTDAIIAQDASAIQQFTSQVDSAAVVVNASTRFNDGGEIGLGAEIGISTDKFHARGPCGVRELTSYKYIITGTGHIRT